MLKSLLLSYEDHNKHPRLVHAILVSLLTKLNETEVNELLAKDLDRAVDCM